MRCAQTLGCLGLGAVIAAWGLTGCGGDSGQGPTYLESSEQGGAAGSASERDSKEQSSTKTSGGAAATGESSSGDATDSESEPLGLVVYTKGLYEPTLGAQALAALRRDGKTATLFGKVNAQGYPYELTEIAILGEKSGTRDPKKAIRVYYDNGFPVVVVNEDTGATLSLAWGLRTVVLTMGDGNSVTLYRNDEGKVGVLRPKKTKEYDQPFAFHNVQDGGYTLTYPVDDESNCGVVLPGTAASAAGTCDAGTSTPGAPDGTLEGAWMGIVGRFLQNRADDLNALACDLVARDADFLSAGGALGAELLAADGMGADEGALAALGVLSDVAAVAFQLGRLPAGGLTTEGLGLYRESAPKDVKASSAIPTSAAEPYEEFFYGYVTCSERDCDYANRFVGYYTADGKQFNFREPMYEGRESSETSSETLSKKPISRLYGLEYASAMVGRLGPNDKLVLDESLKTDFQLPTDGMSDHNLCTLDLCIENWGSFHPEVVIDDESSCTIDSCDPKTGVRHKNTCDGCNTAVLGTQYGVTEEAGPFVSVEDLPECGHREATPYVLYSFTAPEAATYRFLVTGEAEEWDSVLDIWTQPEVACGLPPVGEWSTCNDDGSVGVGSRIDLNLSSGQRVTLRVRGYEWNEDDTSYGPFTLIISKLDEKTCPPGYEPDGEGGCVEIGT